MDEYSSLKTQYETALIKEQMEKVQEHMKETMSIDLKTISEKLLPEEITAKQINNIQKIIK